MIPGHRESRRLEGNYFLNENDVRSNRIFEDAVAYGGWPMDVHVRGGIADLDKLPSSIYNFDGVYTIPYRCYCSRNVKNLMMCGRDVSCSKMAFSSLRVQGTCAVGGQAVGTAAAMCVQRGLDPAELAPHMKELQQQLLRDDCYIPGFRNEDENDLARKAVISSTGEKPGCGAENVINGITRTVGGEQNCWESLPLDGAEQVLSLRWDQPQTIREVRVTFDPDLTTEIMPTIISSIRERQPESIPPRLVRDYEVRLLCKGKIIWNTKVKDNAQRLNVLTTEQGIEADELQLAVTSTNGAASARVYEVRAYA